jgi:hypothetical protein
LIAKLWPGDAGAESHSIAEDFASRFEAMPMAADYVEGLLREGARLDAAIGTGETTREEALAFLSSDSLAQMGMPPHLIAEVSRWGDERRLRSQLPSRRLMNQTRPPPSRRSSPRNQP